MEIILLMNPHLFAQCAMRLTNPETLLDQRKVYLRTLKGGGASDKEPTGQYRRLQRHGLDPCVGMIPVSAAHSRILAWRIAWTEEPGGL